MQRADGGVASGLLLFTSTPQSIAKPSPGWNKVALLTAVRNSPCSCPFSVSLHPPLAALNSEPRPGSLLVRFTNSYIKPALKGEVDASATSRRRGCIGAALIYGNPSVNPPCGVLPAPRPGSLLGAILYAKIYELTLRLEQGRLTHCRS